MNVTLPNIIKKISLIVISFILFVAISKSVENITSYPFLIAFVIIITIIVFTLDNGRFSYAKYFKKSFFDNISEAQEALEKLNDSLNRAIRYHEITKLIAETFDIILKNTPYAYFIMENNRYYLAHYRHLEDDCELLVMNLKTESFTSLTENNMIYPEISKLGLDHHIESLFKEAGLTTIFPFWGHDQVFALLFTDQSKIDFYKDDSTLKLFQKIQKKAGLILENSALFLDLEKKNYETTKIIEVSQKILSSLDTKNILDFILDSLQKIIQFDAASIFLLDESGKVLLNTSSLGYDNSLGDKLHLKVGDGACGWVVQTKQVDVLDDVRGAEHYCELRPQTHSQISIPLIFEDKVLGVICVESNQIAYFRENLVEILKLFAHLAAIAVHNARQFEVMLAKQALEHELINASTVQKRLLVQEFPAIYKLSITAENIASKIVSGDIYDFIKIDDTTLGIAIGDVSGKGAPAALMMTLIMAALRSQYKSEISVDDIVFEINNLLYDSISRNKFASFFYAHINTETHKLTYTNAGHNPPIVVSIDGSVQKLTEGGIVMGYVQNHIYEQDQIPFQSGDILAAYTDGVTETVNNKNEEFGERRFIEIIVQNRQKTVEEIQSKIIQAIKDFSNDSNPIDDITLIICKHN